MQSTGPQALVVGGGVVGRSVAYQLSKDGFSVRLMDAGTGHSPTTRGSLGVLTHFNGSDNPLSRLYRDSHESYAQLADELREVSDVDIGWRCPGGMDLIFTDEDETAAVELERRNRERGCPLERLDGDEVLRLEPEVSPRIRGALFFPGDHCVDPERLSAALGIGLVRLGGTISQGECVTGVGEAHSEMLRVETSAGQYAVDYLVLAAGAWTRELAAGVGATVPVRPIRGQHARATRVSAVGHVLRHGGHHLIPAQGHTVVGATVEEVGFDLQTTAAAGRVFTDVWQRVLRSEPSLDQQRAGLRPKPKGGRPLIGPLSGQPRVFVATGHYKNGVLMGPVTGRIVAAWMRLGTPPRDMSYFRPER